MRLTSANAAPYLIRQRLVDADTAENGGYIAIDASRRNRNIKVQFGDGTGLFVKQTNSTTPGDVSALHRQAVCYALPDQHDELAAIADIMPRMRLYDAATNILTLDLIAEGESMYLYHERTKTYPARIAAVLGDRLAKLHAPVVTAALDGGQSTDLFPRTRPWIFSALRTSPASLPRAISPAIRQLIELVQRHPGFAEAIEILDGAWASTSLIHADLKWDNCVLTWPDGPEGPPRIVLVDWEVADIGDPSWDVGSVLQTYLSQWTLSIPDAAAALSEPDGSALRALDSVRQAISAFWESYADRRGIAPTDRSCFLERSMQSAGARMIQTAYESIGVARTLTPGMEWHLGTALELLTYPHVGMRRYLEIS